MTSGFPPSIPSGGIGDGVVIFPGGGGPIGGSGEGPTRVMNSTTRAAIQKRIGLTNLTVERRFREDRTIVLSAGLADGIVQS